MRLSQKLFHYIFWAGYSLVLITAFLPVDGSLEKIKLGPVSFQIRLDHLLHFTVYFLICIYFLFGRLKGITLFEKNSLGKFVKLIVLLAIITEVVQLWIPQRAFNIFDLLSNLAGLIIGLLVIRMMERNFKVIGDL